MFNTLRYARILEAAGVLREQAEAHVQIIAEIVEGDLTTKQDLKDLEFRLIIKLSAVVVTVAGLMIAVISLLLKYNQSN